MFFSPLVRSTSERRQDMPTDTGKVRDPREDDQFQRMIDAIEIDGVYMLDPGGHVVTWNRGAELNKGYSKEEILGKHFQIFFTPEDREADLPNRILAMARTKGRYAGEGWRVRKNGERFWASTVMTALRNSDSKLHRFVKVIRDMTAQKRQEDVLRAMEAALREERDRLYAAAECSLDALFICDALRGTTGAIEDFVFTYLNSNVEKIVSIPRSKLIGGQMCELLPLNRANGLFEKYKQVVLTGKPFVDEFPIEHEDVNSSWLRIQAVKLRDGVAITASDITARKRDEECIRHMAQHDSLTGLPNRTLLEDRICQAIERSRRDHNRVGVLLIDLDCFKQINDNWGHDIGDEVLCIVARRLVNAIRSSDSMIRVGGDEFVAIVPEIQQIQELVGVIDKIIRSLEPPILVRDHSIQLTCSIGISVYPDSATHPKELLARADTAMYASKHGGKNQFKFFGHRSAALKKSATTPIQSKS